MNSDILPYNSCIIFADDITIFSAAKNSSDATVTLQNITNQTVEWLDNRLTMNISKCNSIVICSKHKKDAWVTVLMHFYVLFKNCKIELPAF